jgi:DNA invertase Pin-like site-specific DNA recombinase
MAPGTSRPLTPLSAPPCPDSAPGSGLRRRSRPGSVQKTSGNAGQPVPTPSMTYRSQDAGAALGAAHWAGVKPQMCAQPGINKLTPIVDVSHFRGFIGFMVRAAIYYRRPADSTDWDPSQDLRQAVEGRGGIVVAAYVDDDGSTVRTRNAGWKTLLANLGEIDEVVVASAGDLPGRNVRSLLCLLATLRDHGVSLCLHQEGVNTGNATASDLLDIAGAWQRAKLSKAIKIGQTKAVEAGKIIGRPAIPRGVVVGIERSLASGAGIRWTARRFAVSGGTVINIRKSMTAHAGVEAG